LNIRILNVNVITTIIIYFDALFRKIKSISENKIEKEYEITII